MYFRTKSLFLFTRAFILLSFSNGVYQSRCRFPRPSDARISDRPTDPTSRHLSPSHVTCMLFTAVPTSVALMDNNGTELCTDNMTRLYLSLSSFFTCLCSVAFNLPRSAFPCARASKKDIKIEKQILLCNYS